MKGYPYAFHIALDGNGINGLEGMAGVCLFLFDPVGNRHAYKIVYFDGIAAGHAVSVNPSGTVGYLGNAGQHLLFYDAGTLNEIERISTLRFETARTSLQGSTHVIWLSDDEIVTPIGEHFYAFRLGDLANPRRLVRHGVKLPHGMKRTASGRYIVYGSMDNPADGEAGEARHVGIWDRRTDRVSVLSLPATCWHVAAHPSEDIFYAVSFRVAPQDHRDYHEWGMAYLKEYAFEIDAREQRVRRHWAAGTGDSRAYQFRHHAVRQRADLLQRRQPVDHRDRARQLRAVPHHRRASRPCGASGASARGRDTDL